MPRLCNVMMQWGQRATWVIFGILETYNEPCQLYVYISGITGKSCSTSIICLYKWVYNMESCITAVPYDSNEVLYA